MKKVIAFILFTVMILGLYGCHIFNGNDGNGGNGGNDGDDLDNQNPPASDNQLDLPENEVNVIIIAGQSNAEGNSNMSNLDKYCADNGYDFSQFVYGFEDVKISFHHHFYYADLNAYVTDKIDPFNTNFVDVKVGQGCAPKHSGPELGLAQVLHENVESTQPIYIIRYASGGTPFTGYPSWKSPSSGETGLLYNNLITYVNDGLENLKEQGLVPKVRAFVWMQGEADGSNANAANAYKNNMKNMVNDIRDTYSSYATDGNGENIVVVDGHIADSGVWPYYQTVNRAKTELSEEMANYYAIDTNSTGLDLKLKNDDKYGGGDAAHYTMESILKLGRAFGEKILEAGCLKYNKGEVPTINDFTVDDGVERSNVVRLEAENGNIKNGSAIKIEAADGASGGKSLGYFWDNGVPYVRFVVESDRDEENAIISLALTSAVEQTVSELPHPLYKTGLVTVNGKTIPLSGILPARNGNSWHTFYVHSGFIDLKKGTNVIDLHYDFNCSYSMEEFRINVDFLEIQSNAVVTEYKNGVVEPENCVVNGAVISFVDNSPTTNSSAVTTLNQIGASITGSFISEKSGKAAFAALFGLNSKATLSEYFELEINGETVAIPEIILNDHHFEKLAGADWREYIIADFDLVEGENIFKLNVIKEGFDANIASFKIYSADAISTEEIEGVNHYRFEAEHSQIHNGTIVIEYSDRASNGTLVGYFREGKTMVFTIISDKAENNVPIIICGATAKESGIELIEITAEEIASMFACNGVALRDAKGSFAGSSNQDWYNFTTVSGYVDLKEGVNILTLTNLGPSMNMDYIQLTTTTAQLSWTPSENAPGVECTNTNNDHNCDGCGRVVSNCDAYLENGMVEKEASCVEEGLMVYTCSLCGNNKEEIIPKTHECDTIDVSGSIEFDARTGSIINNNLVVNIICTKCGQGDEAKGFTVDTTDMFTKGLVVTYSDATAILPAFNTENYTVSSSRTGGNDPSPIVTTTFVSDKLGCTVTSGDYIVVDGKLYSRYDLPALNTDSVEVTYEGGSYIYNALSHVTLTKEIRTYGCFLTVVGDVTLDLTERWTHNNGLIIGNDNKPANVKVNVTANSAGNAIFFWDGADLIVNEGSTLDVTSTDAYNIWSAMSGSHIIVDGTLITHGHIFFVPTIDWVHPEGDVYNSNPELYVRKGNVEINNGNIYLNFIQVGSVAQDYSGKLTVRNGSLTQFDTVGDEYNKNHPIRWIFSQGELNFENTGNTMSYAMKTDQNNQDRIILFDAGIKVKVTGAYNTLIEHDWGGMGTFSIHTDATFDLPVDMKMYNHNNNYSSYSYNTFTTAIVMIDGEMKEVFVTNTPDVYVVNTVVEYSQDDLLKVDNADGTRSVGAIEIAGEFTTVDGRTRVGDWFFSQATDANGNVIYYRTI